jgi:hypothetical protein
VKIFSCRKIPKLKGDSPEKVIEIIPLNHRVGLNLGAPTLL